MIYENLTCRGNRLVLPPYRLVQREGRPSVLSWPLSGTVSSELFGTLHAIASSAHRAVSGGPGVHFALFSGRDRTVR